MTDSEVQERLTVILDRCHSCKDSCNLFCTNNVHQSFPHTHHWWPCNLNSIALKWKTFGAVESFSISAAKDPPCYAYVRRGT